MVDEDINLLVSLYFFSNLLTIRITCSEYSPGSQLCYVSILTYHLFYHQEQGYCQNYPFRAHRDLPAAESTCPPAAFLRRVNKRFRTFTEAKILRIEKFLDQAIPKETLTRNHDSMDAFLELDVMFDPPPSQLVLYYFISLAFQKALGLKVDFTEVRDLMLKGGDINAKDNLGQTVLHDACRQMDVKTVR